MEVIYRGIFQKTLAKNICRGIVFAARKDGKIGIAFGRYSDSPERNGIPAKQFAVVSDTQEELQEHLARYEPTNNDVTIACDDSLCKGVESWAWYGLQPINKLLRKGGTLLVTSIQSPNKLINSIHRKGEPYNLALIRAQASFSGLWVYKGRPHRRAPVGRPGQGRPAHRRYRCHLRDDQGAVEGRPQGDFREEEL